MENNFLDLIAARHCKRSFLDKEVSKDVLGKILQVAANAPSSKNTQPWQVTVVSGEKKKELSQILCQKFDEDIVEEPDFKYLPNPMPEEFLERAKDCGYSLYELKGIEKRDVEKRKLHERENYKFFGAPVCIYFHLPHFVKEGSLAQSPFRL